MAKRTSRGVAAARKIKLTMRVKLIAMLIITLILGVSIIFSAQIDHAFGWDSRLGGKTETDESLITEVLDGELIVHFVDAGQGDCTIIQFPDGKTMIVDGGEKDQKEKLLAYIATNVKGADGAPLRYFDYCILTHTDSDHCGSLDDILNEYPASVVYRPNVVSNAAGFTDPVKAKTLDNTADLNEKLWTAANDVGDLAIKNVNTKSTAAYKDFVQAAYNPTNLSRLPDGKKPTVIVSDGRRDQARPEGKATTDIINEKAGYEVNFYSPLSSAYKDSNDYSNILTVSYNNRKLMLTGDAEKGAEKEFVETYASQVFDVDVLKLGHHGSRTSSSEDFLNLVMRKDGGGKCSTDYFVVSSGLNNKYGHPHKETMTRLTDTFGVPTEQILRTDTNGDILMSFGKIGTSFNGSVAVQPSFTAKVSDVPVEWWHVALSAEILTFVLLFFVIGTLKRKDVKKKR